MGREGSGWLWRTVEMSDGKVWAVETETEVGLPDQIQHSQLNLGFILMSNFWLEYFPNMEWNIPLLKHYPFI